MSIFTDGSKDDMGIGSGVFCNHPSIEFTTKMPSNAFILQAEILAIRNAAKLLLDQEIRNNFISIYVDSQAAIKALDSTFVNSKLVNSTISNLNKLSIFNSVRVCWILNISELNLVLRSY